MFKLKIVAKFPRIFVENLITYEIGETVFSNIKIQLRSNLFISNKFAIYINDLPD